MPQAEIKAASNPQAGIKAASYALLNFLDTVSPHGAAVDGISHALAPICVEDNIHEYRKEVDALNKYLDRCLWITGVLLQSLDDLKRSQEFILERLSEILEKAESLLDAGTTTIYLPNAILRRIAQYVYPDPISVQEATKLRSSKCRWDKIVLESSILRITKFDVMHSSSLLKILNNSTTTKLDIDLDGLSLDAGIRLLAPYCGRWQSLRLRGDVDEDDGRSALFSVSCPNCPRTKKSHSAKTAQHRMNLCKDHSILSSLKILSVPYSLIPSLSGLIKGVQKLTLVVTIEDKAEFNFSTLVTSTPQLSDLTIVWNTLSQSQPGARAARTKRPLLPNLKKISFVQQDLSPTGLDMLNNVFRALDGSSVEDLSLQLLAEADKEVVDALVISLGRAFPNVRSLELQTSPAVWEDWREGPLLAQAEFLEMLDPIGQNEHRTLFPRLQHITVEFDYSLEGRVSFAPIFHRGCEFTRRLKSIDLVMCQRPEDVSLVRSSDPFEMLSRIQNRVNHVTVRNLWDEAYA